MLGHWWVNDVLSMGGVPLLAAWVIWIIASITLHELAHGWAAISRGDDTPIHTGHMTWNPVVHMGLPSLLVFALSGIAWGAMPIDPSRIRGRYGHAWVALCGPLMNFFLATFCVVVGSSVLILLRSPKVGGGRLDPEVLDNLTIFFWIGCALNIALGLFNLIPVPPLDGSRILGNLSRRYAEFTTTDAGGFIGMLLYLVAFFFASELIFDLGYGFWKLGFGLMRDGWRLTGLV